MKECAVVGKANVGKTLFVLNFAEYLGVKQLEFTFLEPVGRAVKKRYQIDFARKELVGAELHKTVCLQSVALPLPGSKGIKGFTLSDTTGLADGIHEDIEVRLGMAQTLRVIRRCAIILHLVDASRASCDEGPGAIGEVDYQVARFASTRCSYALLANKMDLPGAGEGYKRILNAFRGYTVFPISALKKKGFKEVKAFVWRCL